MSRWKIGDVTITRVIELEMTGGTRFILPDALRDAVKPIAWLRPHFADEAGNLVMSIHALVVETKDRRILVDTCIGNDKVRQIPAWSSRNGPFLQDLAAAGYPVDSIDTVLCTHLHIDHVGFNTSLKDGRWVPTFPHARYLFGREEWEHWNAEEPRGIPGPIDDSVRPIVDAGLHQLVEVDHRLSDEISLEPDARPHAGSRQRAHPLARRGGAHHRRFRAPPLPDGKARLVLQRRHRSRAGDRDPQADVREPGGRAGVGHRHPLRDAHGGPGGEGRSGVALRRRGAGLESERGELIAIA
jgi:hypothetical protein